MVTKVRMMNYRGNREPSPQSLYRLMRELFIRGLGFASVLLSASCGASRPSPIRWGGGYRLSVDRADNQTYRQMAVREGYRERFTYESRDEEAGADSIGVSVEEPLITDERSVAPEVVNQRDRLIAFLPVTGDVATMGKAVERGILCAFQQEGEDALPEVIVVDAGQEGDAPRAALAAALKGSSSPVAIVGPFLSSQVDDVATIAREHRVASFNLSKRSSSPDNGVIDVGFSVPAQLTALVKDGIIRAGVTRLAMVRTATPFSEELATKLRAVLSGTGIEVIFDGAYGGSEEFSGVQELVQKLEGIPVEGIFIADTAQGASRLLSAMGGSLKNRVKIFGPGAWYNLSALRAAQGVFANAIFPVPFVVSEDDKRFEKLDRCLPPRRNRGADFLSALGFDVGTIIALQREGRLGEYNGLTGVFSVDERRVKRTVAIGVFNEGTIRPFRPVIRSLADVQSPGTAGSRS